MGIEDCWARSLGDCRDGLSREHIVSEGLWDTPTIRVQGFDWCKEKPEVVGVGAITIKQLCAHHNSTSSPLDTEAGRAFRTIKEFADLGTLRDRDRVTSQFAFRTFSINGLLLERWFLKTSINALLAKGDHTEWFYGRRRLPEVPDLFPEVVWGRRPWPRPFGLYVLAGVGGTINFNGDIVLQALLADDGSILGFASALAGLVFLLNLAPESPPPSLQLDGLGSFVGQVVTPGYHFSRIDSQSFGRPSHALEFRW